jgi:hypothetical protein
MGMKIIDDNGNERNETRPEILARHARMNAAHIEGMKFLETIHAEIRAANPVLAEDDFNEREAKIDAGLTTEINRSTSLVSVSDTNENILALLRRHKDWEHAPLFLDKVDLQTAEPVKVKSTPIKLTDLAHKLLARKK